MKLVPGKTTEHLDLLALYRIGERLGRPIPARLVGTRSAPHTMGLAYQVRT